jgi:hypothetical protein
MATAGSSLTTFSGAWLTIAEQNAVVGYPAAETYPGPVTTDHSTADKGDTLSRNEPLQGAPEGAAFPGEVIPQPSGAGVVADTAAELGHSAPMASFDAQTVPFAPPGPVADTHGLDTGGTYRTEHVPMPRSPGWWRRVITMQTYNRQAQVTDTAGWDQLAVNDRLDHIQDQGQNADAYDPRWLPYSERPVTAKLAAEAFPVQDAAGGYIPVSGLSDRTPMGGQGNLVYEAPPDPAVNVQPAPQAAPVAAPDPVMEYVR